MTGKKGKPPKKSKIRNMMKDLFQLDRQETSRCHGPLSCRLTEPHLIGWTKLPSERVRSWRKQLPSLLLCRFLKDVMIWQVLCILKTFYNTEKNHHHPAPKIVFVLMLCQGLWIPASDLLGHPNALDPFQGTWRLLSPSSTQILASASTDKSRTGV